MSLILLHFGWPISSPCDEQTELADLVAKKKKRAADPDGGPELRIALTAATHAQLPACGAIRGLAISRSFRIANASF